MAPRQVWLFQLGCWAAFATALLHLAAHVLGPQVGDPHAAAGLAVLTPSYVFLVPGLRQPTYVSVFNGFSLSVSLLIATLGAAGLVVFKHSEDAPHVVRGVSRAFAIGSAVLLALSVAEFFSLETFFIAVMALCFALAAVNPEG